MSYSGDGVWKLAKRAPQLKDVRPKTVWTSLNSYWVNDGAKAVWMVLYLLGNIAVIAESSIYYRFVHTDPYDVLSYGIVFARLGAAALQFNCALILLPVLRNFLSWIRGSWLGEYVPVDKAIVWHKKIAWVIAFFTFVHITAHYVNFNTIENFASPSDVEDKLGITLDENGNPPTAWQLGWATVAGTTGHIAAFCLVIMYTTAVESVRRPMFELFWFSHHLFIVFFALIIAHGFGYLFGNPVFWAWVLPGLFAYLVERIVRLVRGSQTTILHLAVVHPSNVLELQMQKANFRFNCGQYLFLNCPYIGAQEWHPFTISSAPEEEYVSVHIRIVGDWTGKLMRLLNPEKRLGVVAEDMLTAPDGSPILRIDGPFGAASEDIFKFEVVMLIGAGIGVTPFASILKSIRYRVEAQQASGEIDIPIQKAFFYWVAREKNSFEWFLELLCALEESNDHIGILELNTYLTSMKSAQDAGFDEGVEAGRDPITGLRSGAHYGRPKFEETFQKMADQYPDQRIGVFFCGPAVMSKALYKLCRKFTSHTTTKFYYHKENF